MAQLRRPRDSAPERLRRVGGPSWLPDAEELRARFARGWSPELAEALRAAGVGWPADQRDADWTARGVHAVADLALGELAMARWSAALDEFAGQQGRPRRDVARELGLSWALVEGHEVTTDRTELGGAA